MLAAFSAIITRKLGSGFKIGHCRSQVSRPLLRKSLKKLLPLRSPARNDHDRPGTSSLRVLSVALVDHRGLNCGWGQSAKKPEPIIRDAARDLSCRFMVCMRLSESRAA